MDLSYSYGWSGGAAPKVIDAAAVSPNTSIEVDVTVAANQTNHAVTVPLTIANLKAILIDSDQPVVIKTNSTGSPDDTFSLDGVAPLFWVRGSAVSATAQLIAQPFSANVATFYVTTTAAATIRIRAALDN